MAEESRKEDDKNGILDRINAWAVSENPFAKFVRFVAATLYSGGVIVGGLVSGVTNTLLGREIAGKEREYDLRKSAERDLKEKIKDKETPSDKESKQTDERKEKSCEEMNHDSFLKGVTSDLARKMYQEMGLSSRYNEALHRLELFVDDDKKITIGTLPEEQYINGISSSLSDVVLSRVLDQDGLAKETLPPAMLQDYQNKADIAAALMQSAMFMHRNGHDIRQAYDQYSREHGDKKDDPQFMLHNFTLGKFVHRDDNLQSQIQIAFEPSCAQGISIYRNGEKLDTYSMDELVDEKLIAVAEKLDQKLHDAAKAVQERKIVLGDITVQKTGEQELSIINTKKGEGYKLPLKSEESLVAGISVLKKTGLLKTTPYEGKDSALVTTIVRMLDIPMERGVKNAADPEKAKILNTVSGRYEALEKTPYILRKDKNTLQLLECKKKPVFKTEFCIKACDPKQIIRAMKKNDEMICGLIRQKLGKDADIEAMAAACQQTAEKCLDMPYRHLRVDGLSDISLCYNKSSGQIEFCSVEGYQNKEYLLKSIDYEKATEHEIYQMADILSSQKFMPARSILAEHKMSLEPACIQENKMHEDTKEEGVHSDDIHSESGHDPDPQIPEEPDRMFDKADDEKNDIFPEQIPFDPVLGDGINSWDEEMH